MPRRSQRRRSSFTRYELKRLNDSCGIPCFYCLMCSLYMTKKRISHLFHCYEIALLNCQCVLINRRIIHEFDHSKFLLSLRNWTEPVCWRCASGFVELLNGLANLLEHECNTLVGTAHPESVLQPTHAVSFLRSGPQARDPHFTFSALPIFIHRSAISIIAVIPLTSSLLLVIMHLVKTS